MCYVCFLCLLIVVPNSLSYYMSAFSVLRCDAFPLLFPHTNDARFAFNHQLFVGGSCAIE